MKFNITCETDLERKIVLSPIFEQAISFGNKRKGHPEAQIKEHIKQILDFIDSQSGYPAWIDYREELRLLALLHDLGKHRVVYSESGYVVGKGHSAHSADIAREFLSEKRLIDIIEVHDKYFHFYSDSQRNKFKREKFIQIYSPLDLGLLIRFNYSDSNNRERESVKWFEDMCINLGLREDKIYETEAGVLK